MKLLMVAGAFPTPDRNSADFRLCQLLAMLTSSCEVAACIVREDGQAANIGEAAVARYRAELQALGVTVLEGPLPAVLRANRYDAVMFEWHFPAVLWLETVRHLQPQARILIDSVDVVFSRLEAKARVSGQEADAERARTTRRVELAIYAASDLVITVTDADAEILRRELPGTPTLTIPNIHPLQPTAAPDPAAADRLLFIGSYARPGGETNIDAMRWFCAEILPLIAAEVPQVRLRIVGGPRNDEIDALAGPHVEVLGFVPETRPYLQGSAISIAPLRFGGGMKGKIGEAMSYALPVVTTPTGIEGFGLEAGTHALVAENPRDFADHVLALLREPEHARALGLAGYEFIRRHYSDEAVAARVAELLERLPGLPLQHASLTSRLLRRGRDAWDRHVGWRFETRG